MTEFSLHDWIDKEVTLEGTAENAKGGAIILLPNQEPVYIRYLVWWVEHKVGMKISMSGILRYEKYIPDPEVAEDGAISQGAIGKQFVLDNAREIWL
ncbi:MAG: hypothetical protein P1Q69_18080 [Candidatus Thorarchaeota archaeon]|nr:hypothetical protein [Candidatus Thorarchaeota archaeon]